MSGLTPQAMAAFRQHHGVATSAMLQQGGLGRQARASFVGRGVLLRPFEHVYRIASAPDTLESRCVELCFAFPRGFITGPTAGKLTGLRQMPGSRPIHFGIAHGSNLGPIDGVVVRQSTRVAPIDVQLPRDDGIRIASPPRLAFDLGANLTLAAHASVVEQLLFEKRCTLASIVSTARRLLHPRRPGSFVVAATLESRVAGPPPESHPEVQLAAALRSAGIPIETQTTWLELPNGTRARIDLVVPGIRWGIEVDVHPSHLLLDGTTRDKRRDRQCHLIGWEVERVTLLDLRDLRGLVLELKAIYMRRLGEQTLVA